MPNNGVVVTITTTEFSSGCSPDQVVVQKGYFGMFEVFIELDYFYNNQVGLCKCLRYDIGSQCGAKSENRFTILNSRRLSVGKNFMFCITSETRFLCCESSEIKVDIRISMIPRDLYNMPEAVMDGDDALQYPITQ